MTADHPQGTLVVAVLICCMLVSGCIGDGDDDGVVEPGKLRTYETFVDLGEADGVDVNLDIGTGELKVAPGGSRLLEATFRYNVDRWKPRFSYVEEGEVWNLSVWQPDQGIDVAPGARNEWDLRFGLIVPMAVNVEMGSGTADVTLGGLDVVSVSIRTGAGDVALDLSGEWYDHLVARVGTGTGNVNLVVPSEVGVQVSVKQGSGTVVAPGFSQRSGNYVNEAFDTAELVFLIAVDQGVGDLIIYELP